MTSSSQVGRVGALVLGWELEDFRLWLDSDLDEDLWPELL